MTVTINDLFYQGGPQNLEINLENSDLSMLRYPLSQPNGVEMTVDPIDSSHLCFIW